MQVRLCSLVASALLGLVCFSDGFRIRQRRKRSSVVVGTLGGHTPGTWSGACNASSDGSLERALCNLNVYEEAVKTAQSSGVDLLVLPEYGLINGGRSFHTDVAPSVGDQPCGLEGSSHAQVSRLACLAGQHGVALASNVQTSRGGNKYITEIVYDKNGTVVAVYDKHRLFPGEGNWATRGPYNPTVFELFGQKWGICICYEAMDPFAGWGQFNSFRDQGAGNILWSVGNTGLGSIFLSTARKLADKVHMNVFGTMNEAILWGDTTTLVDVNATNLTKSSASLSRQSLSALGYGGSAFIDYATVWDRTVR